MKKPAIIFALAMTVSACVSSGDNKKEVKTDEWICLCADFGNEIYFSSGEYDISDESKNLLNAFAKFSKSTENVLYLHGYADSVGNRTANRRLSEKRLDSVRRYLVINGVSEENIKMYAHGESGLVYIGSDSNEFWKNRRVKIVYSRSNM